MKGLFLSAVAVWALGLALIVLSIGEGGASVFLVVIVPVVTGSSFTFLAGVVLLFVGIALAMLAFPVEWVDHAPPPTPRADESPGSSGGVGGVVMIGPVPIVFGSWRGTLSRRARWMLVLAGAAAATVAVSLAVVGLGR